MKVLYFIVQQNLSLDLFSDLVDLMIVLGSDNLKNLKLAKNAQYNSAEIVAEFIQLLSDEVRQNVYNKMGKSPTYSLMVDEVMDIASHKDVAICARYIGPDSKIKKNAFISDPCTNHHRYHKRGTY